LITGGTVRNGWFVCLFIMVFGLMCSAAQRGDASASGEQFLGTWSGSWEAQGAGGGFELPPNEAAEVVFAVTFDEKKAKGTWSLRAKAGNTEVASGTLNFTRQ
jgi:hypothetical protein